MLPSMRERLLSGLWDDLVGPLGRGASATVLLAAASSAATVAVSTSRRAGVARGAVAGAAAHLVVGTVLARVAFAGVGGHEDLLTASDVTLLIHAIAGDADRQTRGDGQWRR